MTHRTDPRNRTQQRTTARAVTVLIYQFIPTLVVAGAVGCCLFGIITHRWPFGIASNARPAQHVLLITLLTLAFIMCFASSILHGLCIIHRLQVAYIYAALLCMYFQRWEGDTHSARALMWAFAVTGAALLLLVAYKLALKHYHRHHHSNDNTQ